MNKFENYDSIVDGCHLQTFGVLFEADRPEEAIRNYQQGNVTFWKSWRGSFCGVLRDDVNDITLLFNDHIGSKMVFYAETANGLAWSRNLYEFAHSIGAKADNEDYLWQILTYGFSPVGETLFKNINRLQAGEYIYAHGNAIEKRIYHRFDNTPNNLSFDDNIERLDVAFRKAVARVIKKNEEYGYPHFIALSAGMDSRMVNRVAHELAKTPIHNITYSQTGYYDETIPRELSEYWQNVWHFTRLDGGECLRLLDEASAMTYGLIQYSGASETLYGMPEQAKNHAGVMLSGTVGDYVGGTAYTKCQQNQPYRTGDNALLYNYKDLARPFLPENFEKLYPNLEILSYYVRSFNAVNLGSPLIQQQFGESYSPFCDVDFLNTMLAIPIEQRWNYRIYDEWILRKYPDMTRWKHNGIYTIGHRPTMVSLLGRAMYLRDVPKRITWFILKKLHIHDFYRDTEGKTMTPEDSWLSNNESLRTWAENYFESNIGLLDDFPQVQRMAKQMNGGAAAERMQVWSLLACLRQAR